MLGCLQRIPPTKRGIAYVHSGLAIAGNHSPHLRVSLVRYADIETQSNHQKHHFIPCPTVLVHSTTRGNKYWNRRHRTSLT